MRQVFPRAHGSQPCTPSWPTVFDMGTSPCPCRLLDTHHTDEQRLAALSRLSYLPSGFPRTPVASPTDMASCLTATPRVRGVSATTRAYRPPAGLGHPVPEHTRHVCPRTRFARCLPFMSRGNISPIATPFFEKGHREWARNSHATKTVCQQSAQFESRNVSASP